MEATSKSSPTIKVGGCSGWASLPPELLRDIFVRIDSSNCQWPDRRSVVACAVVCSSWREIMKEIIKTTEVSGSLTLPISLKQPGPREKAIQCFIKRDRTSSSYHLFLGPSPTEICKFLLAARKWRRPTSTDYIISLDNDDISRGSNSYVGKLRSNFLGTKFSVVDSQPCYVASSSSSAPGCGGKSPGKWSPQSKQHGTSKLSTGNAGSHHVASIAYELNVLGTRGPRRMQCTLHSIPASSLEPGGTAPTPTELNPTSVASLLDYESEAPSSSAASSSAMGGSASPRKTAAVADCSGVEWDSSVDSTVIGIKENGGPLILKNKAPRWHEQLQCWCLNFRGRVTVASVKNFQLVAATEGQAQQNQSQASDQDKVILQFGKIDKDLFTMDYRYPLSAFQAFAICLSSFDTKLACE